MPLVPGITLVILALGLVAPTAAHGECGDYVAYAKPTGDHSPSPMKCHGPSCSRVPAPPPMPQAPPLRILVEDSLPFVGGDSDPSVRSISLLPDAEPGSPVRRASDIYHPPR
jgi:hypothetical protein